MKEKIALIITPAAQVLSSRLGDIFEKIDIAIKFVTEGNPADSDYIFVDYDLIEKNNTVAEYLPYAEKTCIVTTLSDHIRINDILKQTKADHLFGFANASSLNDIKDYILYKEKGTKWSINRFVPSPTKSVKMQFKDSLNLQKKIDEIIEQFDFSECFEGFGDYLSQILNEFLTNGIYNAPVDNKGEPLYRHYDRKMLVELADGQEVKLEMHEDDKNFALSVKDPFGSLTKDSLKKYLTHGEVEEKKGGAGIGIFLSFKYAHQMIINITPKKETEFIVVMSKIKRHKQYFAHEKCFHLFYNL